jgi:hypothetical protein
LLTAFFAGALAFAVAFFLLADFFAVALFADVFVVSTARTGDTFLPAGFFVAVLLAWEVDAVTVALPAADEAARARRRREVGDGLVDPGTVGGVLGDTNNLS